MNNNPGAMGLEDARKFSEESFRVVVLAIQHAFNIECDTSVPYTFDLTTRARVCEHVLALMALRREGTLTPRFGAAAQDDVDFQRMLSQVLANTPATGRKK